MKQFRIYFSEDLTIGCHYVLKDNSFQHISALRLKVGATLFLFNGTGYDYQGKLIQLNKREAHVEITDKIQIKNESPFRITLAQGISRPAKMDIVIQKSVELGCSAIVPLITQYCDIKHDPNLLEKRLAHWKGIVISACEQCGRSVIPNVYPAQFFNHWVSSVDPSSPSLILDPYASTRLLDTNLTGSSAHVLIGPEGGFHEDEVKYAKRHHFLPIQLGARILRTETATLTALSILQYRFGDLGKIT